MKSRMKSGSIIVIMVLALFLLGGAGSLAAETTGSQAAASGQASTAVGEPAAPAKSGVALGLIAIGAGLAVGLAALATGIAQARIGAAGSGTIAEKPDLVGTVILMLAIPETMVILGFVIAIVMLFTL